MSMSSIASSPGIMRKGCLVVGCSPATCLSAASETEICTLDGRTSPLRRSRPREDPCLATAPINQPLHRKDMTSSAVASSPACMPSARFPEALGECPRQRAFGCTPMYPD